MINQWIWSVRNFWTNAGPGQLHGKYPLIDSPVIVDLVDLLEKKMIENH